MKVKLFILLVLLLAAFGFAYAWDDDDDDDDAMRFGPWLTVDNLGSPVNSPAMDSCVSISKDGLSLFFSSNRDQVAPWDRDIYVSQRASTDDDWGDPQPLDHLSNAGVWES